MTESAPKLYQHDTYGLLRAHQRQADDLAIRIVAGTFTKKTVQAFVTPGGGKSRMGAIMATTLLRLKFVDRILWVGPRDSLRQQTVSDFHDPNNGLVYRLQTAKGDKWPSAKQLHLGGNDVAVGVVTTYHTIAAQLSMVLRWIASMRVLVIFDEGHHLGEDGIADVESDEGSWTEAAKAIADAATIVLDMSGTPTRHGGGRIALLDYHPKDHPDANKPIFDITYSRRDALDEWAVLPINFERLDGVAHIQHLSRAHEIELSKATKKRSKQALRASVSYPSEYRDTAVRGAVEKWLAYRENNYRSRMIVIADGTASADHFAEFIRTNFREDVALVHHKIPGSADIIRKFRDQPASANVLVTVGMAHEGLDVPDCTHLVFLTTTRSRPWCEQAFARVTRFNRKCGLSWDDQTAHIFLPDDESARSIIAELNAEQVKAVDERTKARAAAVPRGPSSFVAVGSEKTVTRYSFEDRHVADADARRLDRMAVDAPELSSTPLPRRIELARKFYPHIAGAHE